jgi:hypothetical protein
MREGLCVVQNHVQIENEYIDIYNWTWALRPVLAHGGTSLVYFFEARIIPICGVASSNQIGVVCSDSQQGARTFTGASLF